MEEYVALVNTCEKPVRVGYDESERRYIVIDCPKAEPPWEISLTAQQAEMLETSIRICRQSIRKA